jgi:hypothetical protein
MANVSGGVQIETRIKHELSIPFQSVAGDRSVNVGTPLQWDLDELAAVAAFKRMRARRKSPEATAEDFAQAMERNGLAATAERLRDAAELI